VAATELIKAAHDAAHFAYAPYSRYYVGAALLMHDGSIITAANFENASYGLSLCAETVAIAKASSEGLLDQIREIAVAGRPADRCGEMFVASNPIANAPSAITPLPITPCGRCRQVIKEVADLTGRDIPIHCADAASYVTHLLSELLPHAFGPSNLK
jgi:cytidine deaminase